MVSDDREQATVLRCRDLVYVSISAVVILESIGAAANLGPSAISLWAIVAIAFFIPYAFVTAKLAAGWPGDGGIYLWIHRAFGARAGSMAGWLYWVNIGLWLPAMLLIITGSVSSTVLAATSPLIETLVVLALVWLSVLVCMLNVRWIQVFTNVAVTFKLLLIAFLAVAALLRVAGEGWHVSISPGAMLPQLDSGMAFVSALVISLLGLELTSAFTPFLRNPARDIPRAVAISGVAIILLYATATLSILILNDGSDFSIVTAIADTMAGFLTVAGVPSSVAGTVIILWLAVIMLGTGISWISGSTLTVASAELEIGKHPLFAHRHVRFQSPDYALCALGLVATGSLLAARFATGDPQEFFWSLFAVSSLVSLLPYLLMFPALIVLSRGQSDTLAPGWSNAQAVVMVVLGEAAIVAAVAVLLFQVPAGMAPIPYFSIVVGGTALTIGLGALVLRTGPSGFDAPASDDWLPAPASERFPAHQVQLAAATIVYEPGRLRPQKDWEAAVTMRSSRPRLVHTTASRASNISRTERADDSGEIIPFPLPEKEIDDLLMQFHRLSPPDRIKVSGLMNELLLRGRNGATHTDSDKHESAVDVAS